MPGHSDRTRPSVDVADDCPRRRLNDRGRQRRRCVTEYLETSTDLQSASLLLARRHAGVFVTGGPIPRRAGSVTAFATSCAPPVTNLAGGSLHSMEGMAFR